MASYLNRLLILCAFWLCALPAIAGNVSVPYIFTPGEVLPAAYLNSDFAVIYNAFNGNITNVNINASAAISPSKIAFITTAGGVLYTNGTTVLNTGAGTSGYILTANGASAPTWQANAAAGQIVASPQLELPFYSASGTSAVLTGNPYITTTNPGTGVLTLGTGGGSPVTGELILYNGGIYETFLQCGPSQAGNVNFNFPITNGTSGYVLQTDGSGNTSWVNPTSATGKVTSSTAGQIPVYTGATTVAGTTRLSEVATSTVEQINIGDVSHNGVVQLLNGGASGKAAIAIYNGATNYTQIESDASTVGNAFVLPSVSVVGPTLQSTGGQGLYADSSGNQSYSQLQFGTPTSETGNFNAVTGNFYVITPTGTLTVTLPSASGVAGQTILLGTAGTNTSAITLGSNTVNGINTTLGTGSSTGQTFTGMVLLVSDGTNWMGK